MTRLFTPLFPARHVHGPDRPAGDAHPRRSSSAPHRGLDTPAQPNPHNEPQNPR
ncbi:hypothetical protein [Bounagaea algeriensis]